MILVVDQKRTMAGMLARRLQGAGYEAAVAADAPGALESLAAGSVRLALLDPSMPGGGFNVLARMRADPRTEHIPVILFGTSDAAADVRAAHQAGAAAFLVKGRVTPNQLLEEVRRHYPGPAAPARAQPLPLSLAAPPAQAAAPTPAAPTPASASSYVFAVVPYVGDAPRVLEALAPGQEPACRVCAAPLLVKLRIEAGRPQYLGLVPCQRCASAVAPVRRPAVHAAHAVHPCAGVNP